MANETDLQCIREDGHDVKKYIAIILSVLLSLIVLLLLYGIVWFERFGSDAKRTLINQLFASICSYLIVTALCLQFPITVRIIINKAFNHHVSALIDVLAAGFYKLVLGKLF